MSNSNDIIPAPRPYSPDLVCGMARVQAHYLLRVLRENDGSFAELAASYTSLQALLPGDYAWDEFCARAEPLLLADTDTLSDDERVARFMAYASPMLAASRMTGQAEYDGLQWFGCFRYHPHPEEKAISLHIRNNCMPNSPFDDMPACFRSLRQLGETAAATEPFEIVDVMCGSWLNDLPVFLSLFPPSYRESLETSPPNSKYGFGWWGQLVDKTGRLHAKRAAMIIETGVFPHSRKFGKCGFTEFMQHVTQHAEDI